LPLNGALAGKDSMTLIERIAVKLDLLGIPVGQLSPYNLITDLCPAFVKAMELNQHGIYIEGQVMTFEQFKNASENYIGLDLVSEILNTEVRDGINIHDHALLLIRNTLSKAQEYPAHYERVTRDITADINKAQEKFAS
jgi:hypothetical protein